MGSITDWITAVSSVGSTIGVFLAYKQLASSKEIARMQFEDSLAKEYRELIMAIPTKALLGEDLSSEEFEKSFDEIFRYFDLTNQQIFLRSKKRVSKSTWLEWIEGIKSNMSLSVFKLAWEKIKSKSNSFDELRRLEQDGYVTDPADWNNCKIDLNFS